MALIELAIGLIAFALVVTVPGYFITLAFFPGKKGIDSIERLAFSFVFSISFLPLLMLIENQLFGILINFFNVLASLLLLIIVAILIYFVRTQKIAAPGMVYKFFPKIDREDAIEIIPKLG